MDIAAQPGQSRTSSKAPKARTTGKAPKANALRTRRAGGRLALIATVLRGRRAS
jgi:hypothetical protein